MRAIHVVSGVGVSAIAAVLLIGCGDGGMMSSMSSPMPTVMITAPAQASTINFGQGVQLAWTSAATRSVGASSLAIAYRHFSFRCSRRAA